MTLYSATLMLFLVMDPIGNIPVFMSILKKLPPHRRHRIIIRESMIAFTILVLFLFFGHYVLQGLHITSAALNISGGIVLFIISLRMMFPHEIKMNDKITEEPFIVPLAVPLIAGPSALATVLLLATQHPENIRWWFLALVASSTLSTLILASSGYLMKLLGERFLMAMERLMGMILTTLAVQMFLGGIRSFFNLP